MHIHADTKRAAQVIQGVTVQAPHPFVEGHTMTSDQADFFNRTLATRIGQTVGQRIKKQHEAAIAAEKAAAAKESREPVLVSLDDHLKGVDLQKELDSDYADFDFTSQRGPGGPSVDPVEKLARQLAEAKLKANPKIVAIGVGKLQKSKPTEGSDFPNKWAELINTTLERNPDLRDTARAQLEAAKAETEANEYGDLLDNLEEIPAAAAPTTQPAPAQAG